MQSSNIILLVAAFGSLALQALVTRWAAPIAAFFARFNGRRSAADHDDVVCLDGCG